MLTFEVENFGPIRRASVRTHPLTVFIGPNGAGKSVMATAMYAACSPVSPRTDYGPPIWQYPLGRDWDRDDLHRLQDEVVDLMGSTEPPSPASLSPRLRDFVASALNDALRYYGYAIPEALERAFGSTFDQLKSTTSGTKSCRLIISDSNLGWRITISYGKTGPRLYTRPPNLDAVIESMSRGGWRRLRSRANSNVPMRLFASGFASEAARAMFGGVRPTLYLPAARSGLMQGQRAIAGAIVRRASLAGIEDVRVPALSGVVADFLSRLITIQSPRFGAPHLGIEADRLEREVMHGHLTVEDAPGGFPEIIFTTENGTFPIHRTSSMISELAPVVLMLRNELDPGESLIVEEPEAHLHPASQVQFAASLARLVNQDLQVTLTTHSEFFLQQINNAILASAVGTKTANRLGLKLERLEASQVAAYLFTPSDTGTTVQSLAVDADAGIPDSGFAAVAETLYNQTIALDRAAKNG